MGLEFVEDVDKKVTWFWDCAVDDCWDEEWRYQDGLTDGDGGCFRLGVVKDGVVWGIGWLHEGDGMYILRG